LKAENDMIDLQKNPLTASQQALQSGVLAATEVALAQTVQQAPR
jgi:hypothetical protein